MAANVYDFQSLGPLGGGTSDVTSGSSVKDSAVASGAVGSITAGDICVYADGYWAKSADGGVASAGKYGLAKSTSTDTASADGLVVMEYSSKGLLIKGDMTTAANLAQGILGDRVTLDVASSIQKVDENDPNGVLTIVDYDNAVAGSETITVVLPYRTE